MEIIVRGAHEGKAAKLGCLVNGFWDSGLGCMDGGHGCRGQSVCQGVLCKIEKKLARTR